MFLRKSILKKLMTQAYKDKLTVAMNGEGWLYIAGSYWEVGIKKDFITKETMGDIISLIGELPLPGERFAANKEGNQLEVGRKLEVETEEFEGCYTLTITDVLMIGQGGTTLRLLQDQGKTRSVEGAICNNAVAVSSSLQPVTNPNRQYNTTK